MSPSLFTPDFRRRLVPALCAVASLATAARAGTEIESASDKKMVAPPAKAVQLGMATLGGELSGDFGTVYLDSTLPIWNPGDLYLFLNTRTTLDSTDEFLSSYGLGARYLVPDAEVIIGANAFYDSIHSANGHDYDELGLGFEILTRWVDARFNYYLPEGTRHEVGRRSRRDPESELGPVFTNQINSRFYLLQQQRFLRDRKTTSRTYEAAFEGWNAEIGFLVPGLDKYMEMRLFAGAYGYDAMGLDFSGFKARVEVRPLPGIIANVEYWDDPELMGGHWTGELAVSVPFSFFNLATGRNPFEGFTDQFRPRQREFSERLNDMIIRSHRTMTTTKSTTSSSTSSASPTATEAILQRPTAYRRGAAPANTTPQVGSGEGG